MDTYSVADVSKMLNVNEETIRRWIRDGKLKAIRAVGRGGNTLFLEDVVAFANKPPRAYLIFLEEWLNNNGVAYEKNEDFEYSDRTKALGAATLGAGTATAVSAAATALAPAALSVAGMASTAAMAGPIGIGVAGVAYGAAKLAKRKNQRTYSIRLLTSNEAKSEKNKVAIEEDISSSRLDTESEPFSIETTRENQELNNSEATECIVDDAPKEEMPEAIDTTSVLDKITQAKQMLDAEIITQEEFVAIKARLIAKI